MTQVVCVGTLTRLVTTLAIITLVTPILAPSQLPGYLDIFRSNVPISSVARAAVTSALHWITLGVIEAVARVLTARPVAAISTGDLTRGPGPAPGTDALSSHVVTSSLAAMTGVSALGPPGSLRTRIYTIVSSEARGASTPS